MLLFWIGFIVFILLMLALDLGVFHRHAHVVSTKEALIWTTVWIALSCLFTVFVYFLYREQWFGGADSARSTLTGGEAALQFFTGYLIEKSLSLDNIFVIALVFSYFGVPRMYQHRVLIWGVLGALVMRAAMIAAGAILIARFTWIVYVFGGILLFTAIRMLVVKHESVTPDNNPLIRLAKRILPFSTEYDGEHFFTRRAGRLTMTPLFLVLLLVESMDVLFAVDSVPAIFAVTSDPFLVFTSNVFAILGLRSLYFALAALIEKFHYLKISLVVLLAFVGVKMILSHHYPIPTIVSLGAIVGILLIGILASVVRAQVDDEDEAGADE